MDPDHTRLNSLVKMRLLFSDELLIESKTELGLFSREFLKDTIYQKSVHVIEQKNIIRVLFLSIFFSYLFVNGGDISVPGLGVSLKNIPGVLPLMLVGGSFATAMLIINFINVQAYDALIDQIIFRIAGNGTVDPDVVKASFEPLHFIHKLFRDNFNLYDKNTYEPQFYAKIFNKIVLTLSVLFLFVPLSFFLIYFVSMSFIYLENNLAGYIVRIFCSIGFCYSMILVFSMFIDFDHKKSKG